MQLLAVEHYRRDINYFLNIQYRPVRYKSSHPEVYLRKGALKICSKFAGGHLCQSVISIKLQSNFIEIALRHGCSPANLLHIFRKPFPKNTTGRLLVILLTPMS